ncbi:hypothetical protein RJ639_023334 [Escallonia herrerae]|uniref:Uncharacterized protein n=1 Tax=Escallonia herrerae TaxID=1293975 RepID=A0AA89ADK4_9ASTE|nr:hypothetical protein RJ639_023334 [Escallonia herrerae]
MLKRDTEIWMVAWWQSSSDGGCGWADPWRPCLGWSVVALGVRLAKVVHIVVRPLDRGGGLDWAVPWGNPVGRSDHRLRPGSAGAVRSLDEKTLDERKPLDGMSAPRRTVSDENHDSGSIGAQVGLFIDCGGNYRPVSNPEAQLSSGGAEKFLCSSSCWNAVSEL